VRLDPFINQSRIVQLKSARFEEAVEELLATCQFAASDKINRESILRTIFEREQTLTSCLEGGIAIPHVRLPMKAPCMLAIGRCPDGLDYESIPSYRELRIVVLLLVSEDDEGYLNILASLARAFQEGSGAERLQEPCSLPTFRERVKTLLGAPARSKKLRNRFNHLMLREAEKVAEGAGCSAILIFADTFSLGAGLDRSLGHFKTIVVTEESSPQIDRRHFSGVLTVRAFNNGRLSQLRSAIIIGLTRGIFKYNDRLCCVGGLPGSDLFDAIVVVDLEREFDSIFSRKLDILPQSVKPEVVEHVLAIATELAVEGREGRSVGCLFVVGDTEHVKPFAKPLVINPFYGYAEEDRNILNPFMDETVKEFSSIDGAFIIRGDGVIESAGSFIHAPNHDYQLPGGLGTRHSAGAAISLVTDCLSIVVSASGRQVTLFRRGQMLPLIQKSNFSSL